LILRLINMLGNRNKRKYGGIIAALKLEEFWDSLLPEDRDFIRECYSSSLGDGNPKHLDSPRANISTTQTASGFLTCYAGWAISKKRFDLADKLLEEAIKRNKNATDLHYTYNYLIDLCYKRRDEGPEWLERCINYCLADIEIFPLFKEEYLQQEREHLIKAADSPLNTKKERLKYLRKAENVEFLLSVPSFQRLAIIYEKQGKYEEAIDICKLAISYGLKDSTKSGFEGRIARLTKKLQSFNRKT
jgi:tetratricopeptide (TPR) repeat protein